MCPAQEGVTALQVELLETKLRVNNMAARMGINTRSVHVQTHISYQPSNQLKLQNVDGEIGGSGLGQPAPWEQGSGVSTSFFPCMIRLAEAKHVLCRGRSHNRTGCEG